MSIANVPELYLGHGIEDVDVFVYDFKMTEDVIKSKINLNMHMFSFLQEGKKQVHFADKSVAVNKDQSLLLKKGNCLWTEILTDSEEIYYCRLLFFSDRLLKRVLEKLNSSIKHSDEASYFALHNDDFVSSYLTSLTPLMDGEINYQSNLLALKFEELLLYMLGKYGEPFELFLHSLVADTQSDFENVVEQNIYSSLNTEEIAFLCNMSLSTFKRRFTERYKVSPGKWLRDKRLLRAKELLEHGKMISSEIYADLGYTNLSNFSSAFKQKFGISPSDLS